MRVIDYIIKSLQELGGEAELDEIYKQVNKYRKTPTPSIRARLYEHSSDCDAYVKTNPDLFESSDGKGKGKWRFRRKVESESASWLDEILDMRKFKVGELYTKKDIRSIGNLSTSKGPREPWSGITNLGNAVLLFVNLDKTDAEDDLKFNDYFEGSDFIWESRNRDTLETSYIAKMLNGAPVYLFCRLSKKGDFVYVGELYAIDYDDTVSPLQFQFEVLEYEENPNDNLKALYEWTPGTIVKVPKISTKAKTNRKSQQGYMRDVKKKNAVEGHAMYVAYEYYFNNGYEVEDCSGLRNIGYDYKCIKGDEVIEVEVKGTQTKGDSVMLTSNEVINAKTSQNQCDLLIVHSMEVEMQEGEYDITSHEVKVVEKWNPEDKDLEPKTYKYKVS